LNILHTSLFESNVQIRSGVGYHNVGTGVLRASHQTTIDYVEAHYGQRCGHLPLESQEVAVLINDHTAEIQAHLSYLSQLFGKDIKAISAREVQQEQIHFSMYPMLVVPYINVPETEKRIQTELKAESWGMKSNIVSFLKNKADFYQFMDEFAFAGFRTPDYRIVQIDDLSKEALIFLVAIDEMLKKAGVSKYPLGVMLRTAESDGNYGCCLVYEQKNQIRVVPNGEVELSTYYSSWEAALMVSQKILAATMNQLKETRVVVSRYLDLADSPGMSVVIMNGQIESLGWNSQLQKTGSKACIGTSTYRPANVTLARLQQEYEGQTLSFFEALLRRAAEKCDVDFASIRGVANIDIMLPGKMEETLQKKRGHKPSHYVAECNPRWTNYTDAIMTLIAANRFEQTISSMKKIIQEGIATIDKYHLSEDIDPQVVRELIFQRDGILKLSGTRIICRMAKRPMGFIFAGNTKIAQQEVATIIQLLASKQTNRI
jgi:hypothetical protein